MSNNIKIKSKKNYFCIIPARSGSVRIKNKNISYFKKKPMIFYSINVAKKSKLFDDILVSTDSKKISKLSQKYKARVNGLRSKKLSDNFTGVADVMKYEIKKNNLQNYKYIFCIYPCSGPQIKSIFLHNALKKIKKLNADYLLTTTEYEYPPEKSLITYKKNFLKFNNLKYYKFRTQDLRKSFKDTGSIYIFKTKSLLSKKINNWKITNLNLKKYEILDIDTKEDLNLLKKLLN